MAVLEFAETWNGRRLSLEFGSGRQGRYVRNYTRVFRVLTDDNLDGPLEVLLDSRLPTPGSWYFDANGEADLGAICVRITPEQDQDDPRVWLVTAEYSSDLSHMAEEARDGAGGAPNSKGGPGDSTQLNPLQRPPKIKWGVTRFQKPWQQDLDGKAVLNSAGDPFDPVVVTDDDRPLLTIERNLAAFDESVAYKYRNAVNSDVFFGADPGTFKIVGTITADSAWENGLFYWVVTGQFEYKADGWVPYYVLDAGYYGIDVRGQQLEITDPHGRPRSQPCLLDGNGHPMSVKAGVTFKGFPASQALPPTAPQYLSFRFFNKLPFKELGLL